MALRVMKGNTIILNSSAVKGAGWAGEDQLLCRKPAMGVQQFAKLIFTSDNGTNLRGSDIESYDNFVCFHSLSLLHKDCKGRSSSSPSLSSSPVLSGALHQAAHRFTDFPLVFAQEYANTGSSEGAGGRRASGQYYPQPSPPTTPRRSRGNKVKG